MRARQSQRKIYGRNNEFSADSLRVRLELDAMTRVRKQTLTMGHLS